MQPDIKRKANSFMDTPNILIADDEDDTRATLKDFLSKRITCKILEASNGYEVIDIVKKHIIYRKPLDRSLLVKTMTRFEESLFQLRDMYDLTREQTIKHNMEKL